MTSWAGIVAGGLAGGAAQAVDIAREGLQTDRRVDAARILSGIEEQKQMRLAEFAQNMARSQQTYNTSGAGGEELLGFERRRGEQSNAVALEGRRAEATDEGITRGMAERAGAVAGAAGDVQLQNDIARAKALLPLEIKKAYAVAEAHSRASRANERAPGAELQAKIEVIERTLGRPLNEQEKLGVFGLTKGESDKETVKETTFGKDGSMVETTRTQTRRPGAPASNEGAADPATLRKQAEAAVAAGADRSAVNKMLADRGLAPLDAGAAPAPAKRKGIVVGDAPRAVQAAPSTGLEGLSAIVLETIANNPSDQRAATARAMLDAAARQRRANIQSSMDAAEQYWPQ